MCYVIISKHSHNQSCSETDLVIITRVNHYITLRDIIQLKPCHYKIPIKSQTSQPEPQYMHFVSLPVCPCPEVILMLIYVKKSKQQDNIKN